MVCSRIVSLHLTCYMFLITNFMFLLIKILLILLLGLALNISLLLQQFSDFLRLQSRSKSIITSLNKIVFHCCRDFDR